MWNCDNCGKCCIEYTNQIRFQSDEYLLMSLEKSSYQQQNPLIPLFFRIKEFFKKVIDGKIFYFVPTKADLLPYLSEEEKNIFNISNNRLLQNQ